MRLLLEHKLCRRRALQAAVLLEVVLALVLLVGAAAVIGTGIGSSIDAVERQRLNLHALNLAVSTVAEAQLGIRSPGNGPEAFPAPSEHWSWELLVTPMESELGQSTTMAQVEVVIRHDDPPVVQRLAEVIESSKLGSRAEHHAAP